LDLLCFDGTSGPVAPLDDVSRHRLLDRIVADADAEAEAETDQEARQREGVETDQVGRRRAGAENDQVGRRRAHTQSDTGAARPVRAAEPKAPSAAARRVSWMWVGCAAGALLVLLAAVWLFFRDRTRVGGGRRAPRGNGRPAVRRVAVARAILRAGVVRSTGAKQRFAVGEILQTGQGVQVKAGRAAIQLPQGSIALLSADTEMRILRLDAKRVRLRLRSGTAVFSVTRRRRGQRFEVWAAGARFSVLGTVFAVAVQPGGARLQVFRGKVAATGAHGAHLTVHRGQGVEVTRKRRRLRAQPLLEAKRAAGTENDLHLLNLLISRGAAQLAIHSRPAGATVRLDGVVLGTTPLEATVRPGHRRLEAAVNNRLAFREFLHLREGDVIERDLDLAFRLKMNMPVAQEPQKEVAETADPDASAAGSHKRIPTTLTKGRPRPAAECADEKKKGRSPARRLLLEARRLRTLKKYHFAKRTYERLVRQYPDSAEARAACVSLGLILLGPLHKAAAALRWFDRYLALGRGGVLAQEALYGRIRALRKLGRIKGEKAALKRFLQKYPKALQVGHVKRRLQKLTQSAENERKQSGR
jgi:tetratricopeptide (TPR) repeat protein